MTSAWTCTSLCSLAALFDPGLGTHLHRIPGTTHGGRVAEVKVIQLVDAYAVKQGGGKDINPFGDFGLPMTNHLRAQEATRLPVSGDTDVQFVRTWVVDFVVPGHRFDRERVEPSVHCFGVTQSRPGHRHVKDLDHLCPQ